jgi:hypothetical protein
MPRKKYTRSCRFQGRVYDSISDAARHTGYHRRTIERAIEAGTEDLVGSRPQLRRSRTCGIAVEWRGKIYPSISKAARDTFCSEDAVLRGCVRINRKTFGTALDPASYNARLEEQITSNQTTTDAPDEVPETSASGS